MATFRCPVCKARLTQKQYESALGILEAREAHMKHREDELKKKTQELQERGAEWKAKAKTARQEGVKQGQREEKNRAERLVAGWKTKVKILEERIAQLEKGTTPQTEGLEFEGTLVDRLKKEFPDDVIKHEGKGGDVLHFVMLNRKQAGVIVYECKRTPKILTAHVDQASRAKQFREADFAILVTTGQRKKFSGLDEERNVLIVAPLGVIPLAALLRGHLIEMLKAKISKEKRALIAQRLLTHITSPQYKNPIEEIATKTRELESLLKEEARLHVRHWTTRWEHYQRIKWDTSQIQANIELVLQGKEPKLLSQPKSQPLQLLPATVR